MDKKLIEELRSVAAISLPRKADLLIRAADALARIDAERGKEAVAWFAFADNNGPVPLELWGFDKKECKHAVLESARSVGWKGTIEGYLLHMRWAIRPLFLSPAPVPEGMALVPIEILDRFPEINPSNYDHVDVCRLNAWGVELVIAAAQHPPAPCPNCAESEKTLQAIAEHVDWSFIGDLDDVVAFRINERNDAIAHFAAERDALQAKVAEQRAEIERLQSKLDLLVIERDAQAVLISDQQADVENQTEISNNFAAQVRQKDETIASLRAEVDHRQSLLRESNRNCAEHAGVVWERNVTIAQQAERIAELETRLEENAMPDDYILMADKLSTQAALIEQCESALASCKCKEGKDRDHYTTWAYDFDDDLVQEAIAAIEAHRAAIAEAKP